MVLKVGLEPTRRSTPVPKTGVAAITPLEHMYDSLELKSRRTLSNFDFGAAGRTRTGTVFLP